ncbi:MAG: hypothetical protein JWM47_231 [Acidimicrobiales bacterium]|nr:hypothetical protein [Acidimicrobiales bacterium]
MALNDRNRRKQMAAAQKLLPNGTALGYAIGRSGANPVVVVVAMIGTSLAASAALLLATGSVVIVGLLPMLILQHFISPPRGIVVADAGVALTKRSLMNGKPHDVVAMMPYGYVQPTEVSLGRVKIMVGNEPVWMAKGEEAVLRSVLSRPVQPSRLPTY